MAGCFCSKQNTSPYRQKTTDKKEADEQLPSTTISKTNSGLTNPLRGSGGIPSPQEKDKQKQKVEGNLGNLSSIPEDTNEDGTTKNNTLPVIQVKVTSQNSQAAQGEKSHKSKQAIVIRVLQIETTIQNPQAIQDDKSPKWKQDMPRTPSVRNDTEIAPSMLRMTKQSDIFHQTYFQGLAQNTRPNETDHEGVVLHSNMNYMESLNESAPNSYYQKSNGRYIVPTKKRDVLLSKSPDSDICNQPISTVKQSPQTRELDIQEIHRQSCSQRPIKRIINQSLPLQSTIE